MPTSTAISTDPFAKLNAVPRKGKQPVTSFGDQHEAWSEVAKSIRTVVEKLAATKASGR